ncbi:glycine oxidase ThiO [Bacillus sp. Marseille-Q3570]|uniref:glycine oxidase ThiO n=1 Tax=Bacillus sp. Marseille-Q3570 TaxID=2963522 RepID=UPI0021B7601E|nr:glycine oxidase ThiO [Bacillus sp. Marseille-Q3570]
MQPHYDVIVVGAGVIGCSIAYHVAKEGKSVLVLEKGSIAGKASKAAAGMLGAQTELEEDSPLFQLAKASRAMFPELASDLKNITGIDIGYEQNGIYKVAWTEAQMERFKSLVHAQQLLGEESHWISADELQTREPALIKEVCGAMFIPDDGQVSAPEMTKALAQAAVKLSATIKEYTEVHRFVKESGELKGVETSAGLFSADYVVIAGGAWSEKLLKGAGVELETYPVKGECFSVKTGKRLIRGTVFSDECYIVPKAGGRLIIGATERPGSFEETVTVEGIARLMEAAIRILPALQDAEWEKAWAGIRPQTKDALPYLGVHPEFKHLFMATGHYRNGILLAPITGKLMADLIDGTEIDTAWRSAFHVNRPAIKA